jgi:hypothetical protein
MVWHLQSPIGFYREQLSLPTFFASVVVDGQFWSKIGKFTEVNVVQMSRKMQTWCLVW